jgi:hypothetical protein
MITFAFLVLFSHTHQGLDDLRESLLHMQAYGKKAEIESLYEMGGEQYFSRHWFPRKMLSWKLSHGSESLCLNGSP